VLLAFKEQPCGSDASIGCCRPRMRVAVREPISKSHISFCVCVCVCVSVLMKPFSDQIKLFANSSLKTHCVECFSGLVHVRCSRTVGGGQIKARDL
jgi:hypothetical protein